MLKLLSTPYLLRPLMIVLSLCVLIPPSFAKDDPDHKHDKEKSSTSSANPQHEEHSAHVHGIARLSIALDASQLEINLESPLVNILGFEHAPKTPEEQEKIKSAKQILEHATLVSIAPQAECKLTQATLKSAFFAPDSAATSASSERHNDLDAQWHYTCQKPEALTQIDLKLFSTYGKGLERLQVEWVTDKGASARELTQDETLSLVP